mmetsp:Transcript_32069/g.93133  ORF Transcript_32069/g.93133 Transcript_32069/m.93133 type:complete len:249 (+) Transcript_32069:514-1260(+)
MEAVVRGTELRGREDAAERSLQGVDEVAASGVGEPEHCRGRRDEEEELAEVHLKVQLVRVHGLAEGHEGLLFVEGRGGSGDARREIQESVQHRPEAATDQGRQESNKNRGRDDSSPSEMGRPEAGAAGGYQAEHKGNRCLPLQQHHRQRGRHVGTRDRHGEVLCQVKGCHNQKLTDGKPCPGRPPAGLPAVTDRQPQRQERRLAEHEAEDNGKYVILGLVDEHLKADTLDRGQGTEEHQRHRAQERRR